MKRGWMFALATGAFLWAGIGLAATPEREATKARMTDGKGLFEQKCRTVAGEKIYRKVENVEGVLLMKVRPQAGDAQWSNRDWPGAAFSREATGDEFIATFLGNEYGSSTLDGKPTPVTPQYRGFVSTSRRPGGLPGYRWVEAHRREGWQALSV